MWRRLSDLPFMVVLMGIAAASMALPAAHALASGEYRLARIFLQSGGLLLLFVIICGLAITRSRRRDLARSYLLSLAGAYLILPLMFALPMAAALPDTSFGNAWFEMVSCFTTTGATLYDTPGRLPASLHLWRALVGWMGGLFILVMAGAVLAPLNLGGTEVISGRTPGRGDSALTQITATADPARRLARQALTLFPVYAGLTLTVWLGLLLTGELGLVALSHAMSTLSTSGISPGVEFEEVRAGFAGELVIFLFLGVALSRRMLPGLAIVDRDRPLWKDPELRIAAAVLAVVPLVLVARHSWSLHVVGAEAELAATLRAWWGAAFTTLSFLTTTGFQSGEWDVARDWMGTGSPGLMLAGLAIFGGGVATTAGGVKLLRLYALFRHGERELQRIIHPHSVGGQGSDARRLRREGAFVAWVYFMLFAMTIGVVTAALTLVGLAFEPALVLCLSALTLTGQLAEVAGNAPLDWATLDGGVKAILGLTMVVGRLEMLAVLALFAPETWRR